MSLSLSSIIITEIIYFLSLEDHPVSNDDVLKNDSEPLKLPSLAVEKEPTKDFVQDEDVNSDHTSSGVHNITLLTTDPSAIKDTVEFDLVEHVEPKLVGSFCLSQFENLNFVFLSYLLSSSIIPYLPSCCRF